MKSTIPFATLMLAMIITLNTGAQNNATFDGIKPRTYFKLPSNIGPDDYLAQTVIFKVKPEYKPFCNGNEISIEVLKNYLSHIAAKDLRLKFPYCKAPEREFNDFGHRYADLSRTYEFRYEHSEDLENVINTVYASGFVEYAEPHYIHKLFYTPNDPSFTSQSYLTKIKANLAWDVNKGDTNVVIGITDTGYDLNHEDLSSQVKRNYADPINGTDDDNDGYIDNYNGWDLGENDNNPTEGASAHGVHVSGLAAAATDNTKGIASAGFNCKLLPVKIANATGTLTSGYEGITYAADHGANIINCSWGSTAGGSTGQDVITYASINKNALVVAAAGNDNQEVEQFPGSYTYVICVAGTNNNDVKANFSNYGYQVDVCAPGNFIYSTLINNSYGNNSGTSMASPIAAGAAAVIKSHYPTMNALQVGEQLRVTCFNISSLNPSYPDKLGKGRIDMQKSLAGMNSPSVVMISKAVTDNNDEAFVVGDTLRVKGNFFNYLKQTGNITATATTTSTAVTLIDNTSTLGVMATLDSANNNTDPFTMKINSSAAVNSKITLKINLSDGTYSTNVYFAFTINVDYINININDIATSITSKSLIGFNDFSTQIEGLGFRFLPYYAENMLFDGGLMVGVPGKVSDNVRNPGGTPQTDNDFASLVRVKRIIPPKFSEFDVEGVFRDNASASPLPVEVAHKAFAWTKPGHRRYVIVEYTIKNTGATALSSMYAGIFCDWDIIMGQAQGYLDNKSATDAPRKMGYVYNTKLAGLYAGVKLLSPGGFNHYAIDNDGSNGSINIYTTYTSADKYVTLSTMRTNAGDLSTSTFGRDVSQVTSAGPFTVAAGDSVRVAFAMTGGESLADIQASADSALAMYYPCTEQTIAASVSEQPCSPTGATVTAAITQNAAWPFTYSWSTGQTTSSVAGLYSGTYIVTVTTASGCNDVDTVIVTTHPAVSGTTSAVNASCGSNNGSASVSVSTGTSPFTYIWNSNAGSQTTSSATGLSAGGYVVTISDAFNCSTAYTIGVSNVGAPAVTGVVANANCAGSQDGSVNITVSGGATPYTYIWNNATSSTTQNVSGLPAGTYTVSVTGANNCLGTYVAIVTAPAALSVSFNVTFFGGYGFVDMTTSGGTPPYSFLWSNGATTEDVDSLVNGTYSVTVTDAKACTSSFSNTVGTTTAVNEEAKMTVIPNPNNGQFMLQLTNLSKGEHKVIVSNLLGQTVYEGEMMIDRSGSRQFQIQAEKGVYTIQLASEHGIMQTKFVVY